MLVCIRDCLCMKAYTQVDCKSSLHPQAMNRWCRDLSGSSFLEWKHKGRGRAAKTSSESTKELSSMHRYHLWVNDTATITAESLTEETRRSELSCVRQRYLYADQLHFLSAPRSQPHDQEPFQNIEYTVNSNGAVHQWTSRTLYGLSTKWSQKPQELN